MYDERGTINDERQRTQADLSRTHPDGTRTTTGQNANDGWAQKERVRVKNDIFTVLWTNLSTNKLTK